MRQCMRNVEATLKEAGLDFSVRGDESHFSRRPETRRRQLAYTRILPRWKRARWATSWSTGSLEDRTSKSLALRRPIWPAAQGRPAGRHELWADRGRRDGESRRVGGQHALPVRARRPEAARAGPPRPTSAEQVHQMARNHVAILEAAGLTLDDIVSGRVYLRDMKDYAGHERDLPPVLLARPRRPDLPDAQFGPRARSGPRVFASFIAAHAVRVRSRR